ncbi:MAG: hypothetical protein QOH49_3719 [Acidobacteriota bacterium]|jgi:hypothetical protein|nr:hypothetical protein [Acidobacteriota bacterium]
METVPSMRTAKKHLTLALILFILAGQWPHAAAQQVQIVPSLKSEDALPRKPAGPSPFRIETLPVGRDAQLLTVFGKLDGLRDEASQPEEVPLVSILRDTLGDADPENDRLRQVWMLTYTSPTALQRFASAIPFLYGRVGDKKRASRKGLPPPVIDLADPKQDLWHRFMWLALQNVVFNPYGVVAKASTSALRRNSERYRQAHILRALAILSLYEAETGAESAFTQAESAEIQARLMLTSKTFGGLIDDAYLDEVLRRQNTQTLDSRGHNWELLRQRAETEGLYFEPLALPDGSATHALLWVSREDLQKNRGRKFGSRFLNIESPWDDSRLARWNGHTETRYVDAEGRPVASGAEGARRIELIPLALYGLDFPKIPALLVDFRDRLNPKRREMSHRVIEDVARNVLSLSRYGDVHYFLGRTVFDFVTSRRGIDVNQPTRLRAYSQLKLLLALDQTLDRDLRDEIGRRIETVSLNPLENDLEAEARLAREQYAALVAAAKSPDGLAARLDRDRREEMVPLEHGKTERVLLRFANVLSLGLYKHREPAAPESIRLTLDAERRLAFHKHFLQQVAKSTPVVEVVWNIEDVRRSLRYVAAANTRGDAGAARAAAQIFAQTNDAEARRLCLDCLYRINNEAAKTALLRIYQSPGVEPELRRLTAEYLRNALLEEQRITPEDARAIIAAIGQ